MYTITAPLCRIWQHRGRYLIFAVLLLLLLLLSVAASCIGGAAAAESGALLKEYYCTFLLYDILRPTGSTDTYENLILQLPHVEETKYILMHRMSTASSVRILGADASFWEAEPIEGRMYETDGECVINQSYADFLHLTTRWSGVGDEITVRDADNESSKSWSSRKMKTASGTESM